MPPELAAPSNFHTTSMGGRFSPGSLIRMGGKVKNHMNENGSNQEDSPAERGGRTFPETRNALSKQSAGGGGEERRKAVGTAESSKSKQ
ncbi:hypothetical protein TNCV_2766771 [Trichonephila clavipes]|nr:hypothetical protein TNCV_2766771 [Trichonephila clavipes]